MQLTDTPGMGTPGAAITVGRASIRSSTLSGTTSSTGSSSSEAGHSSQCVPRVLRRGAAGHGSCGPRGGAVLGRRAGCGGQRRAAAASSEHQPSLSPAARCHMSGDPCGRALGDSPRVGSVPASESVHSAARKQLMGGVNHHSHQSVHGLAHTQRNHRVEQRRRRAHAVWLL